MNSPEVSLIFCTRNRSGQLRHCLDYIAQLDSSVAWELVVIDNGSTDDTSRVLSAFAAKVPFPVKVLYESKPGKSRGLNRAIGVSSGDIIAFIDDDCYVSPDHIDRVRDIFVDPRIGFAGGKVELFDPADCPVSIKTSTERELLPPRSYIPPGWLFGANMMFRRQALEAIGGFDPQLGPGGYFWSAEDDDVQQRACFAGWWGLYTPDVAVAHHHRRKAKDAAALRRVYSIGGGVYYAKFLLTPETRLIFWQILSRKWYWDALRILRGGSGARCLWWEAQGAVWYLLHHLRGRFVGDRA